MYDKIHYKKKKKTKQKKELKKKKERKEILSPGCIWDHGIRTSLGVGGGRGRQSEASKGFSCPGRTQKPHVEEKTAPDGLSEVPGTES